jgi:hypothetical protein
MFYYCQIYLLLLPKIQNVHTHVVQTCCLISWLIKKIGTKMLIEAKWTFLLLL